MPETTGEWFSLASEDLDEARNTFTRKKYRYAIYWLQQADEKIAKGLMARLGFMAEEGNKSEDQKAVA